MSIIGPDNGRPFHRSRIEARLVQVSDRRQMLAVGRAGDDSRAAAGMTGAHRYGDHEAAVVVERRAGGTRPPAHAGSGAGTATTAAALPGSGSHHPPRCYAIGMDRLRSPKVEES